MTLLKINIIDTLSKSMSADKAARLAGEQHLAYLEREAPDFRNCLLEVALDPAVNVAIAQLAALTLKQAVNRIWNATKEADAMQSLLRGLLDHGIRSHESKIRSAMASCVSRIAQLDVQSLWPPIFVQLLQMMDSGDLYAIDGSLKVVEEIINEELPDRAALQMAPSLFPRLYEFFDSANLLQSSKLITVQIVRDFMAIISMELMDDTDLEQSLVTPALNQWITRVVESTNQFLETKAVFANAALLASCFEFLQEVWTNYAELCEQRTIPVLNTVRHVLEEVKPAYSTIFITGESTQDIQLLPSLVLQALELVARLSETRVVRESLALPDALASLAVFYMQPTRETVDQWLADGVCFLEEESEEASSTSVRQAALDFLTVLAENFGAKFGNLMDKLVCHSFELSSTANVQQSSLLYSESACHAYAAVKSVCTPTAELVECLLHFVDYRGSPLHEIVAARASVVAALVIKDFPQKFDSLFRRLVALVNDVKTIPGCLLSVKSLTLVTKNCATTGAASSVASNFPVLFEKTFTLVSSGEERLTVSGLNSLVDLASLDPAVASQLLASRFCQILSQLVEQYSGSASVQTALEELLQTLCAGNANGELLNAIVGPLFNRFSQYAVAAVCESSQLDVTSNSAVEEEREKQCWIAGVCLNLISVCLEFAPEQQVRVIMNEVARNANAMGVLFRILKTEDDSVLVQQASGVLSKLFTRFPALMHNPEIVMPTLEAITALLQINRDEACCALIDELLTSEFLSQSSVPFDHLALFKLLVSKLLKCKSTTSTQSILCIFAHQVYSNRDLVYQLCSHLAQEDQTSLTLFMELWSTQFTDVQGFLAVKLHTFAIAQMFADLGGHPLLSLVLVNGDLIVESSEIGQDAGGGSRRIITRSRAKLCPLKYTKIPLSAKWLKLLLAEWAEQESNEMGNASIANDHASDNEDEDDGWEDELNGTSLATFSAVNSVAESASGATCASVREKLLQKHPLYKLSINSHLYNLFKACMDSNVHQFSSLVEQYFTDSEKDLLRNLLVR